MIISENWLREWVNPEIDSKTLAHQLTMAGLEVDSIEPAAPEFNGVVIGKVLSAEQHPNADRLRVTTVDVGGDENLEIVCGAANVRAGLKVAVATVGAVLPGNFKIKKSKLRGVASFGMICSASELGLADALKEVPSGHDSEGIMELADDLTIGEDIRKTFQLDDNCIELDLTPNRGDCLSIIGVAREVAAINKTPVKENSSYSSEVNSDKTFPVSVEASADCPRYLARVIENIDNSAPTPLWMQEKLRRAGLRSLGIIVDITNFVLLELGQPLHAFDLEKLDSEIIVRKAKSGEKLELLDESTVELADNTLIIADKSKPLAMAGVMGGAESAISDSTKNIVLECAFFTPVEIAGKARSYGLHTDSSHRFERGVDPQLQNTAIERATKLITEYASGSVGEITEVTAENRLPQNTAISLGSKQVARVLGVEIDDKEIANILTRLGMSITNSDDGWEVTAPSFRFDIALEADLIEEIGRVYGYDNIPTTSLTQQVQTPKENNRRARESKLCSTLINRAYHEAITYSFVDPKVEELLYLTNKPLPLANPISNELSVMRTSLWSGLLPVLSYNLQRQQVMTKLFEIGQCFYNDTNEISQKTLIAGVVSDNKDNSLDFFDIKSDVESILHHVAPSRDIEWRAEKNRSLHSGQSARVYLNSQAIGWVGQLHPKVANKLDLTKTFVFELDIIESGRKKLVEAAPVSKFPTIRRDLSLIIKNDITAAQVEECITESAPNSLKKIELFDYYTGKGVADGEYSLAVAITLQETDKTLTKEEIESYIDKIIKSLNNQLGIVLRGA